MALPGKQRIARHKRQPPRGRELASVDRMRTACLLRYLRTPTPKGQYEPFPRSPEGPGRCRLPFTAGRVWDETDRHARIGGGELDDPEDSRDLVPDNVAAANRTWWEDADRDTKQAGGAK